MRNKPELIVPIRDRRQHRRVLTLKNFAKVIVAVGVLFAGLTIQSDFRHPKSGTQYGRLLDKQVSSHQTIESKTAAITAAPIEDQTAADPLLVQPQQRAQWLGVDTVTTTTAFPTEASEATNGIVIKRSTPQPSQPLLSGGIFRQ